MLIVFMTLSVGPDTYLSGPGGGGGGGVMYVVSGPVQKAGRTVSL